jgi:hypothetical protein
MSQAEMLEAVALLGHRSIRLQLLAHWERHELKIPPKIRLLLRLVPQAMPAASVRLVHQTVSLCSAKPLCLELAPEVLQPVRQGVARERVPPLGKLHARTHLHVLMHF